MHPQTLSLLRRRGYQTDGLRSKSWDEYTSADSPRFDYVVTVCSNAAREVCPFFPGAGKKMHWDIPDPATGKDADAFLTAYSMLRSRIAEFVRSSAP